MRRRGSTALRGGNGPHPRGLVRRVCVSAGIGATILLASARLSPAQTFDGLVPDAAARDAGVAEMLRPHARLWEALLAAEDARAAEPRQLALLLAARTSAEPAIRLIAVRALGRLERPALVDSIAPLLHDSVPSVAATAAWSVAQALHGAAGTHDAEWQRARSHLVAALGPARESARMLASVATSLGRLRVLDADDARERIALLQPHLVAPPAARVGVLRGLYHLARQPSARAAFDAGVHTALRAAFAEAAQDSALLSRARVLALATLVATGGADANTLAGALEDDDALVRREAVLAAATLTDSTAPGARVRIAAARALVSTALQDASPIVRYEAVRLYARRFAGADGCGAVVDAARDESDHVALAAIDLLGTTCARAQDAAGVLTGYTTQLPADARSGWHRAAHALVSLANVDAQRARQVLPSFVQHASPFVRTYAANAAGILADTATLRTLAMDDAANPRIAAVRGLSRVAGHVADDVYLAQLTRDESELLMVAAAALDGSTHPRALPVLLDALDRTTRQRRETSRDARVALIEHAAQLGRAAGNARDSVRSPATRLEPYLRDFDPVVANAAADGIATLTGERPTPAPRPLSRLPLPSFEDVAALEDAAVVIEMEDGAHIELRLLPFVAPTNAWRFARLARAGYYDGLTFHRVVPNFVVQGGSPAANEYTGDGPFTRDELGAGNWRGTVGLSTRGRDTGDAQMYINLIDNVRLDPDYTVFARVVSDMRVVDRIQEGAVIRSVRIER